MNESNSNASVLTPTMLNRPACFIHLNIIIDECIVYVDNPSFTPGLLRTDSEKM